MTYWPLAEALSGTLGDDPAAEVGRLIAGRPDGDRIARTVAAALGREPGDGDLEIPWAVRRVLETLAEPRPVVLVLDDVQWAEPALHSLVEHLAAFARTAPVLVLCLGRPELFDARPSWATSRTTAPPLLESLTAADSAALVEQLAAGAVGADVRARIVESAEGNPLFAEQLLAMALEDGGGSARLPPTIRALLAARVDRLAPPLRSLLENAAVEGRVFHLGALRAALPEDDAGAIVTGLDKLVCGPTWCGRRPPRSPATPHMPSATS